MAEERVRRRHRRDQPSPVCAQAEADQIAKAGFNDLVLELVIGRRACCGRTDLRAGKVIKIDGIGRRFGGYYYVTSCDPSLYAGTTGYYGFRRQEERVMNLFDVISDSDRRTICDAAYPGRGGRRGHQQPGPGRSRPGQGAVSLAERCGREPLGAHRGADGRQGARTLFPARGRGRGARGLRAWRCALSLRARRAVERQGCAAGQPTSDGKNNVRVIKSRSGHVIQLNDEDGKEKIEIVDKSGKNSIVIDTANEHDHRSRPTRTSRSRPRRARSSSTRRRSK